MQDDFEQQDNNSVAKLIVPAGFVAGMLAGGFFLFGDSDKPVAAAPQAATVSSDIGELQAENARLAAELKAQKLEAELAQLRNRMATGQATNRPTIAATPAPQPTRSAPAPTVDRSPGGRTLAYWNGMNQIFRTEAEMRAAPMGGITQGNALGFLDKRVEAGDYAVNALDALDKTGVDREVVAVATEVRDWYARGLEISTKAKTLMGADSVVRRGTAGMQWRSEEMAHQSGVNALNERGQAVRDRMSKKYGLAFPEME